MAKISRSQEFSRDREFVVYKPLMMGNRVLVRGEPFDKTQVTVRRLRQLFEQYKINFANGVDHSHPLPQQDPGPYNAPVTEPDMEPEDPPPPSIQEPPTHHVKPKIERVKLKHRHR